MEKLHYGTLPNDQLLIPKIRLGKTEVYPEYVKKLAKIQLGLFDRINDIKRAHETKKDTNNPPISPKLRVGDHILIKKMQVITPKKIQNWFRNMVPSSTELLKYQEVSKIKIIFYFL